MKRGEVALVLVLLVLATAKRAPGKGTPPGTAPFPPDENLGVHPLPPNPLKR